MPRVSVIIPVYQVEPYLAKCLDSVLGQSFEDMEIILVNDGSRGRSGGLSQILFRVLPALTLGSCLWLFLYDAE